MTRRELFGMAAAACAPRLSFGQSRPRNVLLIMSDQHKRSCMGAAGDTIARTPNLDALAGSSIRFTNAYCANPVCTPSRASLLTGLYTHNHQAWNNTTPWPPSHKTIAHYFSAAGYMTGLVGKMHFVDAQTHGFDYHLDFNDWYQFLGPKTKLYADELSRANSGSGMPQIDDLWRDFGDPWKGVRDIDDREGPVAVGGVSKIPEQDQFESFVARESIRFLKNFGRDRPFLLITSFLKPHDPFMPAARFAKMFRAEDMRLPESWGKVNLKQVPEEVRESIEHNAPTPELKNPDAARRRIAYYYASLAQMDGSAGAVLRALHDLGLDDNTIVLYTSDHGEMLGEHGMWQKFEFYEGSCGVPLMVRAPGISARVCNTPVSLVSVLPTLAELAGVPITSKIDETSLVPQLREPQSPRKRPVFSEYNLRTPRAKYMIRDGRYKFSYWTHDIAELYDLDADPQELNNLAFDSANKPVMERLKARLFEWYRPPE